MPAQSSSKQIWLKAAWQSGILLLASVVLGISVNQFHPEKLALVADWSPKARLALPTGDNLAISLDEAELLFQAQFAVFIDARSREIYEEGHIKGARSLPWQDFEKKADSVLKDVPLNAALVTYCDGEECDLSRELAFALISRGYSNIGVLINGWTLWNEKKLPVDSGSAR